MDDASVALPNGEFLAINFGQVGWFLTQYLCLPKQRTVKFRRPIYP